MDPKDDMLVAAAPAFRDVASPMTEKNNVAADETVLTPTPTPCAQPRRLSDFAPARVAPAYAGRGGRGATSPALSSRPSRLHSHRHTTPPPLPTPSSPPPPRAPPPPRPPP